MQRIARVLTIVLLGVHAMGCGSNGKSPNGNRETSKDEPERIRIRSGDQELELVPSSVSKARAEAALPMKASEDVSHLLGKLDLPARSPATGKEEEYLPSETVGWVVTIEFPGKPSLDPKKVDGVFDEAWRKKFGGFTCYGRDADTGRWTFATSADGPRAITDLKLEWSYVPFSNDSPTQTEWLYGERLTEIAIKLKAFGEPKLKASLASSEAARRAAHLRELKAKLDRPAVLILKAPEGQRFEGKKIWDVTLCLGLKWGDMDCFHWVNPSDEGEDYLFSVETSTPPGYFLPEEIAASRVKVNDLVFVFSIPRSPAPVRVFESMAKAVDYCQKRLGGQVVDENGARANLTEIKRQIMEVERQLREAGFVPGSDGTLRLF